MSNPKPEKVATEMINYGIQTAQLMLDDMDEEETVIMVREFCAVVARWQPNVAACIDDPVTLGLSCLTTAALFQLAFQKAYTYTDKKMDALHALKKALGESE